MSAMMRQTCKQILTMVIAASLVLAPMAMARAVSVVTTIVSDPLTGVAIDGYDPVSYFTDPQPLQGLPEFEYYWAGVPWYFASAANRDVFMRNPDIYAPQFGGHCEMSLARGYLSDGKPTVYALVDMKLYLFYSAANREAFLLSPREAQQKASANWAGLARASLGPEAQIWMTAAPVETVAVDAPEAAGHAEDGHGAAEHP